MGATELLVLPTIAALFRKQGVRLCGGEEGALRSPPPPLRSAHPCFLSCYVTWRTKSTLTKKLPIKIKQHPEGQAKGSRGRSQSPLVAPAGATPCGNQNQHKIISIRKKSRWTCSLHLLFSDYLTSSQNLSIFPLTTSRLERQKSGFRTSIPTLAATSAIVPEPQERSRRQ